MKKTKRLEEAALFLGLLLILVVGFCSMPGVATRFFPTLFWDKQSGEADRAIISITMGQDRAEATMEYMEMLKSGAADRTAFPYLTEKGLDAAMSRSESKLQRIQELDILYRDKFERFKRLEAEGQGKAG